MNISAIPEMLARPVAEAKNTLTLCPPTHCRRVWHHGYNSKLHDGEATVLKNLENVKYLFRGTFKLGIRVPVRVQSMGQVYLRFNRTQMDDVKKKFLRNKYIKNEHTVNVIP